MNALCGLFFIVVTVLFFVMMIVGACSIVDAIDEDDAKVAVNRTFLTGFLFLMFMWSAAATFEWWTS